MIHTTTLASENSFLSNAPTGIAATLKWKLLDASGAVVISEVTGTGISEIEPTVYRKQFTAPAQPGEYLTVWTNGTTRVTEEVVVAAAPAAGQVQTADPAVTYTRILKGQAATIETVLYDATGTPADPVSGSVTVTVTNSASTVLDSGTATRVGTGIYSWVLTPAATVALDALTVSWAATMATGAQTQTTAVDVAGGYLCSLNDIRARSQTLANTTTYTDAKVAAARLLAETTFEDLANVAFVPRYALESVDGQGTSRLMVNHRRVRTVRSAQLSYYGYPPTALTSDDLAGVRVTGLRQLQWFSQWPPGYRNVIIAYEHGYDRAPLRVGQAIAILAKNWLISGPIDDRALQLASDGATMSLLTPGVRGSHFGIPEVDQALKDYGYPDGVG